MFHDIKETMRSSMAELKDVRVLATCGILAALGVALKFVASIDIGQYIRIGVSDMPGVAVSLLFGPATGGIFWGALDIIKYLVAPNGPFFPGFTISAVVNGLLFGLILYRKPLTWQRMFAAQIVSKVVISLLMNTYWLSILYGNAFIAMLPARFISNAIMLPIDTVLSLALMRVVQRIWIRSGQPA